MPYIVVNGNENLESSLRRFKKMIEREGIIKSFKKKEFFEKPSDVKRRKRKSAIRKYQKKNSRKKEKF